MEAGPASRSRSRRSQRAGVKGRRSSGRACNDNTRSGPTLRRSIRRFQAASKRSSASRASPTRSSRILAKPASERLDIALEVVAQLLDRLELVGRASAAHPPAAVFVDHLVAIVQPVAQRIVESDAHYGIAEHHGFLEDYIWLIAP